MRPSTIIGMLHSIQHLWAGPDCPSGRDSHERMLAAEDLVDSGNEEEHTKEHAPARPAERTGAGQVAEQAGLGLLLSHRTGYGRGNAEVLPTLKTRPLSPRRPPSE